ncbi:hypothetical protein [Streptomyces somaliensis]|uniref:hypothetical protein n=1 Tax=Streptomyces somaliensis TaxID=78355 RepID=UPI0034E97916|nr:hypothetical protein [Streptomyces somaliensis]
MSAATGEPAPSDRQPAFPPFGADPGTPSAEGAREPDAARSADSGHGTAHDGGCDEGHEDGHDDEDGYDEDDYDEAFGSGPLGAPGTRLLSYTYNTIYATNSNVNAAHLRGGQHVDNGVGPAGEGRLRIVAHEGPVSATEILDAVTGFAEPEWFPTAMAELDGRVLFLSGERGTGRRTAALNLLYRHTGGSMNLRAVDSDEDLAVWHPTDTDTRGYLVDGLFPAHPLKAGAVGNLRRLLSEADARMVIVLPDDPVVVRSLARDLHVAPVRCAPPPPRAVFEARLAADVPNRTERARLLANLEPGLLDELLADRLVPAQVRELVDVVVGAAGGDTALGGIRDRLSYLAEEEVPDLLRNLRDDPDGLAFLLATCVFEGMDHRIVREQAERLVDLADGPAALRPPGGPGRPDRNRRGREDRAAGCAGTRGAPGPAPDAAQPAVRLPAFAGGPAAHGTRGVRAQGVPLEARLHLRGGTGEVHPPPAGGGGAAARVAGVRPALRAPDELDGRDQRRERPDSAGRPGHGHDGPVGRWAQGPAAHP